MKPQLDLFSKPVEPKPTKPVTQTIVKHSVKPILNPTVNDLEADIINELDEIPKRILISSDGSEVEFVRVVKGTDLYLYKYTKGLEKIGTEVAWAKDYIKSQLKNYFRVMS
jgi:hypothetical protein